MKDPQKSEVKMQEKILIELKRPEYFINDEGDQVKIIHSKHVIIREGEKIAITGGPESGKTTLLRMLSGDLKVRGGRYTSNINRIILCDYGRQFVIPSDFKKLERQIKDQNFQCLFLDEPNEYIKYYYKTQLRDSLKDFLYRLDIAAIVVTTDQELADFCDRKIEMGSLQP